MTISRITRRPIEATIAGLRQRIGAAPRILAVLEPRSNTMKLGTMKAQLPTSLAGANLVFCYNDKLGWDVADVLRPLGEVANTFDKLDGLIGAIVTAAKPGDHILVMSNGGFGGIHDKLLKNLSDI